MKNSVFDRTARRLLFNSFSPLRSIIPLPNSITRHLHAIKAFRVATSNGRKFRMHSYGNVIENNLYWRGRRGHEPETFLPWLKRARESEVVFDIGSNTGMYALGAAAENITADIFAFEPLPRVAALARLNVELNPAFRIEIIEAAVSNECGKVTLHDPGGDQPSSASLLSDFLPGDKVGIEVNCLTIDSFVEQRRLNRVDLIKLDVEGVEELALQGMYSTLERFQPTLFIEVLDDREELMNELSYLVKQLNYSAFELRQNGIFSTDFRCANHVERNFLFTREEGLSKT